jgi:PAS domain S-box-containing protein
VGEAVIATDLDGTVVYWNPAAERLYGWTQDPKRGTRHHRPQRRRADPRVQAAEIMAQARAGQTWTGRL